MYVFPSQRHPRHEVGVYVGYHYQCRHLGQKSGRSFDRNNHVGDQRCVLHSRYVPDLYTVRDTVPIWLGIRYLSGEL
jgi:hypothetical protein